MAELRVIGAIHRESDGQRAVVLALEGGTTHIVYKGPDWLYATRVVQRIGREIDATPAKLAVIETDTFEV